MRNTIGDDHQRRAERPAGRLEQQDHTDDGDGDVNRVRIVGPLGNRSVKDEEVGSADRGEHGQDPVLGRDVVARRALEGGIGEEREKDREGQMDRARLGVVENPEPDHERDRRGDPDLEQRPEQRAAQNNLLGHARRLAAPGICRRNKIGKLFFARRCARLAFFSHSVPPYGSPAAQFAGVIVHLDRPP